MDSALPPGFESLDPYVDQWVLPDSRARHAKRLQLPYAEIETFYHAMLPLAPRILEYLSQFSLGDLTAAQENLLKLMLSLAEIGPAVEWYGQGEVIDGFAADKFALVEQVPDCAAQR